MLAYMTLFYKTVNACTFILLFLCCFQAQRNGLANFISHTVREIKQSTIRRTNKSTCTEDIEKNLHALTYVHKLTVAYTKLKSLLIAIAMNLSIHQGVSEGRQI